jgi:hypothetical protein
MKSNALRMSFGEWIFRMAETNLPHPARLLAIYAAALHIKGNSELGFLCGIESEKTLAKWKAHVLKSGWVTIEGRSGGRGHGISIGPAYKETPVSFTDVLQRNPGKFYPGNCGETPVRITPVNAENPGNGDGGLGETPVKIAPVSAETPVTATGVSAPASRACIETPSELLISKSYNNNHTHHLEAAREGECEIAPGLFKNCSKFRHRDFVIDVPALKLGVFGKSIPDEKIWAFAEGAARQWASEIANGKRPSDVVPQAIGRALVTSLVREALGDESHRASMAKRGLTTPRSGTEAKRLMRSIVGGDRS